MPADYRSDLIDVACTIVGETDKAYRIDHGGEGPCWVPKSQVEWDPHDKTMAMPEWLAKDKGMAIVYFTTPRLDMVLLDAGRVLRIT